MVSRNDACDYGLHLEAQTTPSFTLQNTLVFLKLHDTVQRAANSTHQTTPNFLAGAGLNMWVVLRHKRLSAEKLRVTVIPYCLFALYKGSLFYPVDFY